MTDLMKRYEAETGLLATITDGACKGCVRHSYLAWLESQLTWRPVSDPPEGE